MSSFLFRCESSKISQSVFYIDSSVSFPDCHAILKRFFTFQQNLFALLFRIFLQIWYLLILSLSTLVCSTLDLFTFRSMELLVRNVVRISHLTFVDISVKLIIFFSNPYPQSSVELLFIGEVLDRWIRTYDSLTKLRNFIRYLLSLFLNIFQFLHSSRMMFISLRLLFPTSWAWMWFLHDT